MRSVPEITADWLLARVVESDGCLLWQGWCENGGRDPRASLDDTSFYVRRAIWKAMHDGRELSSDFYAGVSCGNPRCCEPAHVCASKRSTLLKGKPKSLAHRAKIAATKRADSKLPQERVQDILLSPLKGEDEAERHGICKDMVNRIRAGKARRDYTSPFVQLGAR